ncbi:MAG: hypothetical protein V3T88_02735 [Nitrosomonadaceae bacterium]
MANKRKIEQFKKNFLKAFGNITKSAEFFDVSRQIIHRKWLKDGVIPKVGTKHPHVGVEWHERIREAGLDPITLRKLSPSQSE